MSELVAASRLGDKSDHGGEIITASSKAQRKGLTFAVSGDIHRCPIHGDTPIVARSSAFYENKAFAHIGAKAGCGATIITGDEELRFHVYSEA